MVEFIGTLVSKILVCSVILNYFCLYSGVFGLLDGGVFINNELISKDSSHQDKTNEKVTISTCSSFTWEDVLIPAKTCPKRKGNDIHVDADSKPPPLDVKYEENKISTKILQSELDISKISDENRTKFIDVKSHDNENANKLIDNVEDGTYTKSVSQQKTLVVKATPKEEIPVAELIISEEADDISNAAQNDSEIIPEIDVLNDFTSESSVQEEPIEQPSEQPDVIAPFSQWAEQKLVEEALLKNEMEPDMDVKRNPSKPISNPTKTKSKNNGIKLTKNFASPDCSAKIMGANAESQGSGNVISSSRDEYFLNKCTDQAWFVVELCESIKALKIQIANFELYSSSPDQFKVSIGSVYPGREKDWVEFGTFSYVDERTVQTFKSDEGVVGKYAKVEILSHHGSEHYCPISLFKVYGISEIDLISEDEPNDGHDDVPDESVDDELSEHIIVKTIKDAVHKVVNVFRPQNVSMVATLNTSSLHGASLRYRLRPESGQMKDEETVNRYHMIYYLLATQYKSVKQYTRIMNLSNLLTVTCEQHNITIEKNSHVDDNSTCSNLPLPWEFYKFVRMVHGEDFIVALCNVLSMERGQSKIIENIRIGEKSNTTMHLNVKNLTLAEEDNLDTSNKESNGIKETVIHSPDKDSGETPPKQKEKVVTIEEAAASKEEQNSEILTNGEVIKINPPNNGLKLVSTTTSNSANQAGQTTWQKLSNRIKALERNVTLSTGFLEELSRKYIKQIEELNSAVKDANEAILTLSKKEELAKERNDRLTIEVGMLNKNLDQLVSRVEELQEEVLTRHGLLLLFEVLMIALVFLLCRPNNRDRSVSHSSVLNSNAVDRRRSLDTIRGEKYKTINKQEKRRSSIEVGCLPNGQLGSMMPDPAVAGLSKKQRKRKRRKESRLGLKNVVEDLESDDSKVESSVYDTFHGSQQKPLILQRKRSQSWSDKNEINDGYELLNSECRGVNEKSNNEINNRFLVDQVAEHKSGYVEHLEVQEENCDDSVFEHEYNNHNPKSSRRGFSRMGEIQIQSRPELLQIQRQKASSNLSCSMPYATSNCNCSSRSVIISQERVYSCPTDSCTPSPIKSDKGKSVWFPSRNRKGSFIKICNGHIDTNPAQMEVSNMYSMLDHSVHETSAYEDTDLEGEPKRVDRSERVKASNGGYERPRSHKSTRSKSSSPNRQANLIMRRQREAIRRFQPEQAEWLNKKRDS